MIVPLEEYEQVLDENGRLTLRASSFFEELIRITNLNTPIQGTGSPEGVVKANIGQRYLDTTGIASNALYIKQTGDNDTDTGWILT